MKKPRKSVVSPGTNGPAVDASCIIENNKAVIIGI